MVSDESEPSGEKEGGKAESVALTGPKEGHRVRLKRDKLLKMRVSAQEAVELKMRANRAGYSDVSTFVRSVLASQQEIDRWKFEAALDAARLILRFRVSPEMLEQAKRELNGGRT